MINQLIRYAPALRLIQEGRYRTICEVGSGQNGICKFLDRQVVGVDLDFKDYRTDGRIRIHPNLVPVAADLAKGTGFRDDAFDLVVCVDMLEHLPRQDREPAIREILRIGRDAYIALPIGRQALECDRWIAAFLERRGKAAPGWLFEHLDLEFPREGEIEGWIRSGNRHSCTRRKNDSIWFHKLVVLLEIFWFAGWSDRISRWRGLRHLLGPFQLGRTYREVYLVRRLPGPQGASADPPDGSARR